MAQFPPERIELTSSEAFAIVAALDALHELLQDTVWLGALLDVEDAVAVLIEKLLPEEEG